MSRTLIAPALRHALACKGPSARALGQTLSDFYLYILRSILLSSRGVDGRGGLPPRQSSLVLVGIRCARVCVCVKGKS